MKTANTCMIRGCQEQACHKMLIGKHSPFCGNYEIAQREAGDDCMATCQHHMEADNQRHPWSYKHEIILTTSEKKCSLCKSVVTISNGSNDCVKHMVTIAGIVYNVPCNFYEEKAEGRVHFNENKFHHGKKKSDLYICMECKDHCCTIKQLEEQHTKYIQTIAALKPVSERCPTQLNPKPGPEDLDIHHVNFRDYLMYYISNSYKDWEAHFHSDTDFSLCTWNKDTNISSRELMMTRSGGSISFKNPPLEQTSSIL